MRAPLHYVLERFTVLDMDAFVEEWMEGLQEIAEALAAVPRDRYDLHLPLIARAVGHHRRYFRARARAAAGPRHGVFTMLAAPWVPPPERALLWIADWRPSLAFQLLPAPLSQAQSRAVVVLRREAAAAERVLEAGMGAAGEAAAALTALAAVHGPNRNGEARAVVAEDVVESFRRLLAGADAARQRTAGGILDILEPPQAVEFLAATAQFHLRRRAPGRRRNNVLQGAQ